MKISQILSENEKEFDEKFPELLYFDGGHRDANQDNYITITEDVKFFLRSFHLNLIKGLIEEVEGMKKSEKVIDLRDCSAECKNSALQNVINYLKEEIKI